MQQWRLSRRNVKFHDVRHRSDTMCVLGLHSHEIVGDCCVVNADGGLCVRSNGLDLPTLYRQLLVPCEQYQVLCHVRTSPAAPSYTGKEKENMRIMKNLWAEEIMSFINCTASFVSLKSISSAG